MNNKDVVILDFGGVLGSDANIWTNDNEVWEKTGLSKTEIDDLFFSHWNSLRIGKIDLEVFFADVAKNSKKEISTTELREIYHRKILINPQVLEIAKQLQNKYKLYLLANESLEGMTVKKEKFDLAKIFLKVFNSAELGLYKPDPEIYKKVLELINSNPENVIFIDDQENNVIAAQELGITSLLFTNVTKLKTDMSITAV